MLQGLEDYIAGVGRKIEGLGREEVRRGVKVTRKKERGRMKRGKEEEGE